MSVPAAVSMSRDANTQNKDGVLTGQRTKVLSSTECPSCFRRGTMEVFIRKLGEYTFCYSCGHRETSFYR